MQFIISKMSTPISTEQEIKLKSGLGKAISLIPGKSEEYLLCEFEHNCRLWLRGEHDEPIAYITVSIFGNEPHIGNDLFFSEVTRLYGEVLGIDNMNKVLNEGKIEYLSLSRPLIREPDLINRWQNSECSPAKCVSCNMCYRTPAHKCTFRLRGIE